MLNYCPNCGEKVVKDAAFCVRCGVNLYEITASPNAAGTAELAKPRVDETASTTSPAEKRKLFSLFQPLRRSPKIESPPTEPQAPKHSVRPAIFYGALSFVVFGIVSTMLIPISLGHAPGGREIGGAALWAAICTYLVLRRRNKSQTFSSISAVVALVATPAIVGLVDGVVNRDRYALNREFLGNPAIAAIKDNDPKAYEGFLVRILEISRGTADDHARRKDVVAEFTTLYRRYLRRTPDAALINLYGAQVRRMNRLRIVDPERCYRYGLGHYTSAPLKEGVSEDNRELLEIIGAVIRAGINQPDRPVHQGRAQESIDKAFTLAESRLGAEAHLLTLIDDSKGNFGGACKGLIALLESILELPPAESANVLRSFAAQ